MPDVRHLIAQCPRKYAPGAACGVFTTRICVSRNALPKANKISVASVPADVTGSTQSGVEYFFMSSSEAAIEVSKAGKIEVSAKDRRSFMRFLNCVLSYTFDTVK
jgi:hypothetical protein